MQKRTCLGFLKMLGQGPSRRKAHSTLAHTEKCRMWALAANKEWCEYSRGVVESLDVNLLPDCADVEIVAKS